MKFVNYEGNQMKQGERQLLVLLERNTRPTEAFLKLLLEKTLRLAEKGQIRRV